MSPLTSLAPSILILLPFAIAGQPIKYFHLAIDNAITYAIYIGIGGITVFVSYWMIPFGLIALVNLLIISRIEPREWRPWITLTLEAIATGFIYTIATIGLNTIFGVL